MPGKTRQATQDSNNNKMNVKASRELRRRAEIIGTADGAEEAGGVDVASRKILIATDSHPLLDIPDSLSSQAKLNGIEQGQQQQQQQHPSTFEYGDGERTLSLSSQDEVQMHRNDMEREGEQAESDYESEEQVNGEEGQEEEEDGARQGEESEVEGKVDYTDTEEEEYTDTEEDMDSLPEELRFEKPFELNLPPDLYWQLAYSPQEETITSVNSKKVTEGEPIKEAQASGRLQFNANDAILSNNEMWNRLRDLCLLQRFKSSNYFVAPLSALERLKREYRVLYRKSGRKIPSILKSDPNHVAFINKPDVLTALPESTTPVTDVLQYFQRGAEIAFYGQMGKEKKLQNPGLSTTMSKYTMTANDYPHYFHSNMPQVSEKQISADTDEYEKRDKQRTLAITKNKSWFQRVIVDTFAGGDDTSDARYYRSQGRNWCVQNCVCCDSDQEDCC